MSLLIGQHIKSVLEADSLVVSELGDRVYPVVVTQSTPKFPLVVYQNNGTDPDYSKDGSLEDTVTVTVILLHFDYNKGIRLMNHIRYLFEDVKAKYSEFEVTSCELTNTSEDFDTDLAKYVFSINLTFKTIDL